MLSLMVLNHRWKMISNNEFRRMMEKMVTFGSVTGSTQNNESEELEKDKFTEEEFDKACEDLGLEDSGEEIDDVDDFFQRLNQV